MTEYGTVLNRFIMQSQNNHSRTVYGTGGQRGELSFTSKILVFTDNFGKTTNDIVPEPEVRIMNRVTKYSA